MEQTYFASVTYDRRYIFKIEFSNNNSLKETTFSLSKDALPYNTQFHKKKSLIHTNN